MTKRQPRARVLVAGDEAITGRICVVRGERVMLDRDLAVLYGVETGYLNLAVRRNLARFPADFMFQLGTEEVAVLRSQIAISNEGRRGGRRYLPYAFTELGVAMLSSVLRSERAIAANILIMRTFAHLRRTQAQYAELHAQLTEIARRVEGHDELLSEILSALEALGRPPATPSRPIGFRAPSALAPIPGCE